jgi:hypothetical protein
MRLNGTFIYAQDEAQVKSEIASAMEVTADQKLQENYIPLLVWNGKLYAKKGARPELVNYAEKALEGMSSAALLGSPAVHAIVASGPQCAFHLLSNFFPSHKSSLKMVITKLTKALKGMDESKLGLYADIVPEPSRTGGFYFGAMEHMTGGRAEYITGGCCSCSGKIIGAAELDLPAMRTYTGSSNSEIKEKLSKALLEAGSKLGLNTSGSSQAEKIESMIKSIPAGNKFKKDDATHKKTCEAIAAVINDTYGQSIISPTLPPNVICQQISEFISALNSGMHTEFLTVFNSVKGIIRNLYVLNTETEEEIGYIQNGLGGSSSTDPNLLTRLDLLKIILTESNRQIGLLENIIRINLAPNEKILAGLLKDDGSKSYVDGVDIRSGTQGFGKVISDILKGVAITSSFAKRVEESLKTVGMSLDDYLKEGSINKLKSSVTDGLIGKNLSPEETSKYLKAVDLLYKNVYRNEEIAKYFKGSYEDDDYEGGADVVPKTTIERTVSDRTKIRQLIFSAFFKELQFLLNNFVIAINNLSTKVANELPISDELEGFRHSLAKINTNIVNYKGLYQALVGYYNDIKSRSIKENFLRDLMLIGSHIDTMMKMPIYSKSVQYLQAVKTPIDALTKLIDRYSEEIASKFGHGEVVGAHVLMELRLTGGAGKKGLMVELKELP